MLFLALFGCGDDGSDGRDGADGQPGATVADGLSAAGVVNVEAETPRSLSGSIDNINIASSPVVNFTVLDGAGRGVFGLRAGPSGHLRAGWYSGVVINILLTHPEKCYTLYNTSKEA